MSSQPSPNETSPLLRAPEDAVLDSDNVSTQKLEASLAFRIAAAMYSFAVLGLFTSSIGVMLQPISRSYALTDLHVSFIFLAGPVGYILAAQSNDFIHSRFGQRGIAFLGPIFHLVSAAAIALHPPFPVLLVAFSIVAMGAGLLDGSWCAWAGNMINPNTISGLLHGSFSVGAAAGPFLAGTIMSAGHRPWFEWYYVLVGASILEFAILLSAFRHATASSYCQVKPAGLASSKVETKAIFKHRATWLCAAYFLAYVGTEAAISGWIVSFMARAGHASLYLASLSSSGFWAGMAVGRLALGAVTDRMGVGRATVMYFICAISVEVLFAVVRKPVVSVVFMTLLGFFMGPLFPSGIVVLTRLLPKELHIAATSFVASIGQVGAALLPFGIGAVVDGLGIGVFRYAIIVLSALALMVWIAFSQLRPTIAVAASEEHGEEDVH